MPKELLQDQFNRIPKGQSVRWSYHLWWTDRQGQLSWRLRGTLDVADRRDEWNVSVLSNWNHIVFQRMRPPKYAGNQYKRPNVCRLDPKQSQLSLKKRNNGNPIEWIICTNISQFELLFNHLLAAISLFAPWRRSDWQTNSCDNC